MAKKVDKVETKKDEIQGIKASSIIIDEMVGMEEEVNAGVEEKIQESVDERILLKRILVDNPGAPVFAIIRDTLDDEDPERWNSVIRRWVAKDYFIVLPPGTEIRDGYLTDLGRLYAKTTYNL